MRQLEMTMKDIQRIEVIGQLNKKILTQRQAADLLGLSTRQIKRLIKRYREQGAIHLKHQGRGRQSHQRLPEELKKEIIQIIHQYYPDFGPTFAAEKLLAHHQIRISNESLRKLMIEAKIWYPKQTKVPKVHPPRNRRAQYGELVQIDGSHHDWFEGRAPKCVALVFVDDATSRLQSVYFCPSEDLYGYFQSLKNYVEHYGCPKEIYTDKHSVFTVNSNSNLEKKGQTQFERVLSTLNIKHHLANSPQAKGRVERMNRVLQDRLIKEMRIAGISSINQANNFMPQFIQNYNLKYAKAPYSSLNAHHQLSLNEQQSLNLLFTIQQKRSVSKALTVQYQNAVYVINQVKAVRRLRHHGVIVHEFLNGDIQMTSQGNLLDIQLLEYHNPHNKPISRKELDIQLDYYQYQNRNFLNNNTTNHSTNRGHF